MKKWNLWMVCILLGLLLTACASAENNSPADADAPSATIDATPTEMPRPSAQELTALKTALEWTEAPSFSDFRAVTLDGRTVTQELFADHKLTMVNIWGTFCNPCIAEMPHLAQLHTAYEDGEFQVVGLVVDMLDTDGSLHPMAVELAWAIIDATGANYPHLLPTDDLIRAKLQYVSAVPETIFVDSQGNVLTPDVQYLGARSYDDWKSIVDGLLAQLPQETMDNPSN